MNVRDQAGNSVSVKWSFVLQNFNQMQTSVQITGILLAIPFSYNLTLPNNMVANNVTDTLSHFLQITPSRLTNIVLSEAINGETLCAVTILPATTTAGSRREPNDNLSPYQLLELLETGVLNNEVNLPFSNSTNASSVRSELA